MFAIDGLVLERVDGPTLTDVVHALRNLDLVVVARHSPTFGCLRGETVGEYAEFKRLLLEAVGHEHVCSVGASGSRRASRR
jgi:hypothetical protein